MWKKINISLITATFLVTCNLYGTGETTLGTNAVAGTNGTAIGEDSNTTTNSNGTAVGNKATATGADSTAVGYNARATNLYSTALGDSSLASGSSSTAGGYNAQATNSNATAFGKGATASALSGTAIGGGAVASTGNYATAVGYGASATGLSSTSVGSSASTTVMYGVAFGDSASATGIYSSAIGSNAGSSGSYSTASGYSSRAKASGSIAIGYQAVVDTNANDSFAFGYMSSIGINAQNSAVFGKNSSVSLSNSVLFGSNISETEANVFNVGAKRIKNLLAPVAATDAATKKYVDDTVTAGTVDLSNYYNKTAIDSGFYTKTVSDATFASKTDTYTKAQVDTIVSGATGADLSSYETIANVDTKVATAITTADAHTTTALGSYYDKTVSDGRFASKTDTYTKAQVDTAISSVPGTDLSSYETIANVDTKVATSLTSAKSYADTQDATTLTSAKSYADTNFASKANTYTKTEVDTAISSIPGTDLSSYDTSAQVDTKVATGLTSAKEYTDTSLTGYYTKATVDTNIATAITTADAHTTTALGSYYDKTVSDGRFASKTDTYTKAQVDTIVSGATGADLSGFYTSAQIDTNFYNKTQIDTKFNNYYTRIDVNSMITTAQAEAVHEARLYIESSKLDAIQQSKTYTDDKVANLVPAGGNTGVDKTYVDTSSATAQTTAVSSSKSYTDNKATETLNSANSYTDSKIAVVDAKISQQEADALNASATEVSLTKTSSVTGNVHGVTVTDTQTTITGGTTSTQITLNDDTVDFKYVQTGNAVRLTGVADGINETDAANVKQVNSARDEAISSSNAYTDREINVAKKEAAQGTALALALGTPMNFERGNNAMNIGTGYYHGEKAISLVIGKRVNENTTYTLGVATAGQGATAVKASVGFNW